MKRILYTLLPVLILTGCATGPIMGPCSYAIVSANKKDATQRAIYKSKMNAEAKLKALNSNELGELEKGFIDDLKVEYSWVEKLLPILGSVLDVGIYSGTAYGVSAAATAGKESVERSSNNTTVNGNDNVFVNNGQGTVSVQGRVDNSGEAAVVETKRRK